MSLRGRDLVSAIVFGLAIGQCALTVLFDRWFLQPRYIIAPFSPLALRAIGATTGICHVVAVDMVLTEAPLIGLWALAVQDRHAYATA